MAMGLLGPGVRDPPGGASCPDDAADAPKVIPAQGPMRAFAPRIAIAARFRIQLHIELDNNLELLQAHRIAVAVEQRIRDRWPHSDIIIHQDPGRARRWSASQRQCDEGRRRVGCIGHRGHRATGNVQIAHSRRAALSVKNSLARRLCSAISFTHVAVWKCNKLSPSAHLLQGSPFSLSGVAQPICAAWWADFLL
jgi:hypothetical protein